MSLRMEGNYWSASDNATGADVIVGTWSSATAGVGKTLTSAKTKSVDICADDNGGALSATAYRAARSRLLITAAKSGDYSGFGLQGHYKNTAADTSTGNKAGLWGYYEAGSAATVAANSAGVYAMIDVPSGATIAGSVGAIQLCSNDLGGTHTGKAAGIHMPNPVSGTWDYFAILGTATGASAAGGAGAATMSGGWVSLKVLIGSTSYYIPCSVTITNT